MIVKRFHDTVTDCLQSLRIRSKFAEEIQNIKEQIL